MAVAAAAAATTRDTTTAEPILIFRPISSTSPELRACIDLETASYPADEAATPEALEYRATHAGDYFLGCFLAIPPSSHPPSGEPEDDDDDDDQETKKTEETRMVGYVCATRCRSFTHESMSTHDARRGHLLALHSVVVHPEYRRRGIASRMLRAYVRHVVRLEEASSSSADAASAATAVPLQKLVLLAKAHLLGFYVNAGFTVTRPSPIVHGKESWYELELVLPVASSRTPPQRSPCYVVDAFAHRERRGTGNPAAIVCLDGPPGRSSEEGLDEDTRRWMQTVAAEFNLAETAFVWSIDSDHRRVVNEEAHDAESHINDDTKQPHNTRYAIRYFTPTVEVPLCGHATLAAASVLYRTGRVPVDRTVTFRAAQDTLQADTVDDDPGNICMTFPVKPAVEITEKDQREGLMTMLQAGFGLTSDQITWMGFSPGIGDVLIHLNTSPEWFSALKNVQYDALTQWDGYTRGVILTCLGEGEKMEADFVSRFFAPKAGIAEDPVTGSAHTVLTPYYAQVLGKKKFRAEQWSPRKGWLTCTLLPKAGGDSGNGGEQVVEITGRAVTTLSGHLQ